MKFHKGTRRKAVEYEKDLVNYWREHKIFERSVTERPEDDSFVFYDGPPFITGVPHHGTLLSSIVKDAVPRYWTMKGKRVERVWGWDCHGLPAEVFTEKKLHITDKRDIGSKISLEDYINTCRTNMVLTGNEWEDTIDRIGRWVDFKGAYKTMDKEYMESVWWAFKQLYEKGKIYEGEKVLMYCTRDATPISKAEVAMDNSYQEVTDPSVYVKFKLRDRDDTFLLAWTTTPWTLPSNVALAVNKDETYVEVEVNDQHFIIAEHLASKVLVDDRHQPVQYRVVRTLPGAELVGISYVPLFEDRGENAHKVWHADYVHLDEGTGIVHLSPAYGEEDYALARQNNIPVVSNIDDNGFYTSGEWIGEQVWEINKPLAKTLHERGIVWRIEYIRHSYPHCHRCGTKLMYRAHPSWFMDIAGQRKDMLEQNDDINWFPEHMQHGRFEKTIQTAPDWNLSRDRFWATAMPVWKGVDSSGKEHVRVVGSYAELRDLSGVELDDYHRPWIDDVTFTIEGVTYKRIDKVLDCWFESGSMPFAQFHYPFENVEKFESNFPGDFIAEYVGQVRAWFYYLHAISVGLFGKSAFKNVVVTGTIAGNDGRKMSKSYGNYTDPNELMDQYSADALRFLLLSSPLLNGEDYALNDKNVADIARKLSMIWNIYDFFTLYADVDKWEWDGNAGDPSPDLKHPLDRWVVARVHQMTKEIDNAIQIYDIPRAMKPILPFIDDVSNWYVRRSRRRFWKSGDDEDKRTAYRTLHYVLVRLSVILAPFVPFLSEELYRKLTGEESVHLLHWPMDGAVDEKLIHRMAYVREIINEGLSQRATAGIKVRQPLQSVSVVGADDYLAEDAQDLIPIILEELNVKQWDAPERVDATSTELRVHIDTEITQGLREEGIAREVIRHVQESRKRAGLQVDDHISLYIETESPEINQAVENYRDLLCAETLTVGFGETSADASERIVKIEGLEVKVSLEKS